MRAHISILTLSFVVACGGPKDPGHLPDNKVPHPGIDRFFQIHILRDGVVGDGVWGIPPVDVLSESLGARVEVKTVTNLVEAQEWLRAWHARPSDLLFLGQGLPINAWVNVELPLLSSRWIISTEKPIRKLREKSPQRTVFELAPPKKFIDRIETSFGKKAPNRRLCLGNNQPSGLECHVVMRLVWVDVLEGLLKQGVVPSLSLAQGTVVLEPISKLEEGDPLQRTLTDIRLNELGQR